MTLVWVLRAQATREAQVNLLMEGQGQALTMPAWQEEPRVHAHVLDLYAWQLGRAEGKIGAGKPAP